MMGAFVNFKEQLLPAVSTRNVEWTNCMNMISRTVILLERSCNYPLIQLKLPLLLPSDTCITSLLSNYPTSPVDNQ